MNNDTGFTRIQNRKSLFEFFMDEMIGIAMHPDSYEIIQEEECSKISDYLNDILKDEYIIYCHIKHEFHKYDYQKIKNVVPFSNPILIIEKDSPYFHKVFGGNIKQSIPIYDWKKEQYISCRHSELGVKGYNLIIDTDTLDYLIENEEMIKAQSPISFINEYNFYGSLLDMELEIREDCISFRSNNDIEIRMYKNYMVVQKIKPLYYKLQWVLIKEYDYDSPFRLYRTIYKYHKIKKYIVKPIQFISEKEVKPIDRINHNQIYKKRRGNN